MNLVERWFAELTNSINEWTERWNHNPKPFVWHETADEIFDNLTQLSTTNP